MVLNAEVEFADLLDDLDGALMLHVEGRAEKMGVFADVIITDLGDEARNYSVLGRQIRAKADPELVLADLGGTYYPNGTDSGFGFHYGIRLIDFDQTIDLREIGRLQLDRRVIDASETYLDGLLGVRFNREISEKWNLVLTADASAGDTDGSWGAQAVLGYRLGGDDGNHIRLGYRHFELDLGSGVERGSVESKITMSGPMLGYTFSF